MFNLGKKRRLGGMALKQRVVKVLLKNQDNSKALLLCEYCLRELEVKSQTGMIQEKEAVIDLKKEGGEKLLDMGHFMHRNSPLLLVLGSRNSLRVFSELRLIKKLSLDFSVLNYSSLDINHADEAYNKVILGFNMMEHQEEYLHEMEDSLTNSSHGNINTRTHDNKHQQHSLLPGELRHDADSFSRGRKSMLSVPHSTLNANPTNRRQAKIRAQKLICVRENFVLVTDDMRFCFCKLDKFERRTDAIYNPLSILYSSNYKIQLQTPDGVLFSISVNARLSMMCFTLLIPKLALPQTEEDSQFASIQNNCSPAMLKKILCNNHNNNLQRSHETKSNAYLSSFQKNNIQAMRTHTPVPNGYHKRSIFNFRKTRRQNSAPRISWKNFRFKSYLLDILRLDTEDLSIKPLHPVDFSDKRPIDLDIARSKNTVVYVDEKSKIRLFSVRKENEYQTALVYTPESPFYSVLMLYYTQHAHVPLHRPSTQSINRFLIILNTL